jgi:hypothetical protein
VNKQNVGFWAAENLHFFTSKMHCAAKIAVCAAISSHGLNEPFFFDQSVKCELYWSMLYNSFIPQIVVTGFPINMTVNARRCHTAHSEHYLGFSS